MANYEERAGQACGDGTPLTSSFWQAGAPVVEGHLSCSLQRPFASDQRLCIQINNSSESVMSNMAEGFGRGTLSWSHRVWEIYEGVTCQRRPEMFAATAEEITARRETTSRRCEEYGMAKKKARAKAVEISRLLRATASATTP